LEEDGTRCKGDDFSSSLAVEILTRGGVARPKVGKSSRLSNMYLFSMLGETRISKFSSLNSYSNEDYSRGKFLKSRLLDTLAEEKGRLLDKQLEYKEWNQETNQMHL
jgi:hypothetical protein